ncbi:MAG: agmatinase [Acidobacteriota bacterium]
MALLGIQSDVNSSFLRGAREAPPRIRAALHDGASNWTSERGLDLEKEERFVDAGDREIEETPEGYLEIEKHLEEILQAGASPLVLGGDHAITYPLMRAVTRRVGAPTILQFDAHSDLYDVFEGNRYSHACPFARIMEEGLASRLVQVGIRTGNSLQSAQARRFGVEVHEMRTFGADSFDPRLEGPVYISFDMDCLDPSCAPGVSHHEPGGLTVREVVSVLHRIEAPVIGADIVEYNPSRDVHDMTARVGAKMVKELAALLLAR